LNFFDDAGNEVSGSGKTLMKGRCDQIPIPEAEMRPSRPGSQLEFKAAHITSRYPISVAVYQEGSAAGGMFQAIPTAALGKNYVVAGYFDVTLQDNPTPPGFADSSSSEFMIIATQDNTHVVWTPNSTTT